MQLPQFLQDFLTKGPVGAKKGLDAVATTSERGIWALKWSFIGLAITSLLQVIVFFFSGSTALLADTLNVLQAHELGEQVTRQLRQDVQYLNSALVHTDPASTAGHLHE